MVDNKRQNNFQMAYHEGPGQFVLSNGSVGHGHVGSELQNFTVHKRAVSSKKIRVSKKKAPKGSSGMPRQGIENGYNQQ